MSSSDGAHPANGVANDNTTKPSFAAVPAGPAVLITPLSTEATAWLIENLAEQVTGENAWLIERSYFPDIADAILAANFEFQRTAQD